MMGAARTSRLGLSLIELLVAMAIVGILLAGLLSLISGSILFTGRATSQADRIRDLSDASGFIADSFRSSIEVRTTLAPVSVAGGPTSTFDCGPGSCLAFFTPVFDAATGALTGNAVPEVFVLIPRESIPQTWLMGPAWTGSDATTNVLVRYVGPVVGSTATVAVSHPPSLVLDNVHHAVPFDVDSTAGSLTIRLSSARLDRGTVSVSPAPGQPLVSRVTRRNVGGP